MIDSSKVSNEHENIFLYRLLYSVLFCMIEKFICENPSPWISSALIYLKLIVKRCLLWCCPLINFHILLQFLFIASYNVVFFSSTYILISISKFSLMVALEAFFDKTLPKVQMNPCSTQSLTSIPAKAFFTCKIKNNLW